METKDHRRYIRSENLDICDWTQIQGNDLIVSELSVITYFATQPNAEYFVWNTYQEGVCELNWEKSLEYICQQSRS